MAEEIEPNGDEETGGQRLNRIERVLKLLPEYRLQFREEHKLLMSAQVQMQGGLESLRGSVDNLRGGLETLRGQVATMVTEFREFGRHVETMRKDFDQRLKRLET